MKRTIAAILAVALALAAAGCGQNSKKIVVGATPSPHAEILEFVKPQLEAAGYELEITEFTDYVIPNNALDSKKLDANYFQHLPYLTDFNEKNKTDLVSAVAVHFEPLGIYYGNTATLEEIADGAKIAVPNDTTNEARALNLLAAQGLITLRADAGLAATPNDITENPKNIKVVELAADQIPGAISEVDFAVINGNYALPAGLIDRVLVVEDPKSEAALEFANILAIRPDSKDDPRIKALVAALTSDETRQFITETYGVTVVPVF